MCQRDKHLCLWNLDPPHHEGSRERETTCSTLWCDPEIVEVAALLHDYASVKDKSLYEGHHIHGPLEAEKILKEFRYPPQKIEAVKHCIEAPRASVLQVGNCRGHRMDKKQIRTELEQA